MKASSKHKSFSGFLYSFFKLNENNTNIKTELIAGITTYITMAYALLVIPNILKFSGMNASGIIGDGAENLNLLNDPIIASAFTATCLASAFGTLVMALYANLPFALAPAIGLAAFFTYSVCMTLGYSWRQGLAAVFISGILFILITVTSIRQKIIECLPHNIKLAITAGIGLFITLIGLKSGGIVVADPGSLLAFGKLTDPGTVLTIIGTIIIGILIAKKVKGAMLIGIIVTTLIGIPLKVTNISNINLISAPPSMVPTLMAFDFKGLLNHNGTGILGAIFSIVMVVLTFSMVDLFDTIGTLIGTAKKANMLQADGTIKNMNKALLADAVATTAGAVFGVTTTSTYIESNSGITEGGRTGLTSVITGILLALSVFFVGIVGIVPAQATAPVMIVMGALMLESVKEIDFSDFTEALPAFFTIAIMPFSYSIANGIAVGIIFYPVMKLACGKHKEVHPIMYILAALFIVRYILLP